MDQMSSNADRKLSIRKSIKLIVDGVAKSLIYCVVTVFQELDILYV